MTTEHYHIDPLTIVGIGFKAARKVCGARNLLGHAIITVPDFVCKWNDVILNSHAQLLDNDIWLLTVVVYCDDNGKIFFELPKRHIEFDGAQHRYQDMVKVTPVGKEIIQTRVEDMTRHLVPQKEKTDGQ